MLLAYTVFGLTGFDSTVTAVPLLAHLVPLTFAMPLVLLLPVGVLGVWIGNRLHHALPTLGIVRLVHGLLVISGISLVARVATT